ncbi:uncharacterized protein LOC144035905 isoform X2 [Vanacampus margaritifer]
MSSTAETVFFACSLRQRCASLWSRVKWAAGAGWSQRAHVEGKNGRRCHCDLEARSLSLYCRHCNSAGLHRAGAVCILNPAKPGQKKWTTDELVFSLWWQQRGVCSVRVRGIYLVRVRVRVRACPPVKGHPLPAHIITAC